MGVKLKLFNRARHLVTKFCQNNGLNIPEMSIAEFWVFNECAYYREDRIVVCLAKCASPCTDSQARNWNWPGNTVDREPLGVVCHELGHHVDYNAGKRRGAYSSEYSEMVMEHANEKPISSYAPNPAEWFAEMFRLFMLNPKLLQLLRPHTYSLLKADWRHTSTLSWQLPIRKYEKLIGYPVPPRVMKSIQNKIEKVN